MFVEKKVLNITKKSNSSFLNIIFQSNSDLHISQFCVSESRGKWAITLTSLGERLQKRDHTSDMPLGES